MQRAAPQSFSPVDPAEALSLGKRVPGNLSARTLARVGVFVGACLAAVAAWMLARPASLSVRDQVLLICLAAGIVASGWFPIHVGSKTNLYVSGLPLYLLAALFAPPLAVGAVAVGMLTREASLCLRCANTVSQIMAQVGRWMLIVLAVSSIMHAVPGAFLVAAGVGAVFLLWLGDVVTCPLVLSLPPGVNLSKTIWRIAQRSYLGELMQYLTAFLLFAMLQTGFDWSLFLIGPQIVVLMILLYLFMKGEEDLAQALAQQEQQNR